MTSAVSRSDVEDELFRAGIKSSFVTHRLMRIIDLYALARVRESLPLEDIPALPDPPGVQLLPGESDMEREVTRCKQCGTVKQWTLFGQDLRSSTRHKAVCKACVRGPRTLRNDWEQKWFCPSCEKRKLPEEFPQEKRENPRLRGVKCFSCAGKTPEEA